MGSLPCLGWTRAAVNRSSPAVPLSEAQPYDRDESFGRCHSLDTHRACWNELTTQRHRKTTHSVPTSGNGRSNLCLSITATVPAWEASMRRHRALWTVVALAAAVLLVVSGPQAPAARADSTQLFVYRVPVGSEAAAQR